MDAKKNGWVFISLLAITVILISVFITLSYQKTFNLSLQLYFFILIIFDLAATAFLTNYLKSTAEWTGPFMKGKLKLVGPIVVFMLLLMVGYKYRPVAASDPFDFTVFLLDPKKANKGFPNDTLQLTIGNANFFAVVTNDGQATFKGVDPRYMGQQARLLAKMERFRISNDFDTTIIFPNASPFAISIPIYPSEDSVLFMGFIFRSNHNKHALPVVLANIRFNDFDKDVRSDSAGQFSIYLKARTGDLVLVSVVKGQSLIYSGQVTLSKNMQILANE